MKVRTTISIDSKVSEASQGLKSKGVNISYVCEQAIREELKKFKIKIK